LKIDLEAARWRKSSYSGGAGGNCVEVAADLSGVVGVRDSKNPDSGRLLFTHAEWRAFTSTVQAGRFDCRFPVSFSNSQGSFPLGFQLEVPRESDGLCPGSTPGTGRFPVAHNVI